METLENRQLMAANITANLSGGLLRVEGTPQNDTIIMRQVGSVISIDGVKINGSGTINKIEIRGLSGNDVLRADGNGAFNQSVRVPTTIWGGGNNDVIVGGTAADQLHGGSGNDTLKGGGGSDYLYGGSDNDQLFGGAGVDYLYGGSGNDSLFGGDSSSMDQLDGGSGADRFLLQGVDTLRDVKSEDVKIVFKNGSSAWNEDEIQVVDRAFAEMQSATGSTKVLKDTVTNRDLVFQKESTNFANLGLNTTTDVTERYWDYSKFTWKTRHLRTERLIQIKDFNESNKLSSEKAMDTVIHELAHNWDSGAERSARGLAASAWDRFTAISGWRTTSASTHFRSGDGSWYFSKASNTGGFFGDVVPTGRGHSLTYGKWNPREDFATSVEAWFKILRDSGPFAISGGFAGSRLNSFAQAKLDAVSDFVRAVS